MMGKEVSELPILEALISLPRESTAHLPMAMEHLQLARHCSRCLGNKKEEGPKMQTSPEHSPGARCSHKEWGWERQMTTTHCPV